MSGAGGGRITPGLAESLPCCIDAARSSSEGEESGDVIAPELLQESGRLPLLALCLWQQPNAKRCLRRARLGPRVAAAAPAPPCQRSAMSPGCMLLFVFGFVGGAVVVNSAILVSLSVLLLVHFSISAGVPALTQNLPRILRYLLTLPALLRLCLAFSFQQSKEEPGMAVRNPALERGLAEWGCSVGQAQGSLCPGSPGQLWHCFIASCKRSCRDS